MFSFLIWEMVQLVNNLLGYILTVYVLSCKCTIIKLKLKIIQWLTTIFRVKSNFLPWPPRLHNVLSPSLTSLSHSPHSALATSYFLILDPRIHSQYKVLEISDPSRCTFLPTFPILVSFLPFSYHIKSPLWKQLSQSPLKLFLAYPLSCHLILFSS